MNEIKAETDTELIIAVRDGDLNRVESILTAGADPNEQTPTGWTALKEAAGWEMYHWSTRFFPAGPP